MTHALPVELRGAVSDVAAGLDHDGVGRDIGLTVAHSIPQLAKQRDNELTEEAVRAATSNVVAIVDGLVSGAEPDDIAVPGDTLKWADWLIARNIDASAVPWAYSFGSSRMSDALRGVVGGLDLPAEQRWQLGEGLTRYVQIYVESICAQVVEHFVRAEQLWRSGPPAVRHQLVQRLLAGEPLDVTAASRDIGYELHGTHLAAIVWSPAESDQRPPATALERAVELLLRSCGASEVLTITNADSSAWAWGQGGRTTEHPTTQLRLDDGLVGAIGTVAHGPRGFVRSHQDAQVARHVAQLLSRHPGSVVPYRSVALTALVAQDPERALRFVEGELGNLTDDTDTARRLRATLATYLEEGMRPVRTARRLGIHQNTVAYRVDQAEQAIGRPLSERRLELETALRLADALEFLRASAASHHGTEL